MQIPLNQFEQYIDETILKRGLSYFRDDLVQEPEINASGLFEAKVNGTKEYSVKFKITNETLEFYGCTCPYDMGPTCKHMAAVLFYLQKDKLNIAPKIKRSTKTTKTKKITIEDQLNDIFQTISREELIQFLNQQMDSNSLIRTGLLTSFSHYIKSESKALYSSQLKAIFKSLKGRRGYIHWRQLGDAAKQVSSLLLTAAIHLENNNFKSPILIAFAALEELTLALNYCDDSNADIGDNIQFAFKILKDLSQCHLPEDIRKLFFQECIIAFEKRKLSGWDWDLGILNLAIDLANDDKEFKQIHNCLDKTKVESSHEKEERQVLKLNLLRKTQGETVAEQYLEKNLDNSAIRKEALAKAYRQENWERVKKLALEGIQQDEKSKPGLALDWLNWLLRIAQIENNKGEIIAYAKKLWLRNYYPEQDYFEVLKSNIEPSHWNTFLENAINELTATNRWPNVQFIAKIYAQEQWWVRLIELLKKFPDFNYLEHYESIIPEEFQPELVRLYELLVNDFMKGAVGRSHYKLACRYLRRMIKLGGRETVNAMIIDYRKLYPQRVALMDELNKV